MKKLIVISFFFIFFSLFIIGKTFSYSIPVEDVFSDIDSDYKYKKELQTLYDKGMIFPDSEGKFNPRELLNRDEFVGILEEVTCKKCIQPYTSFDLINKYENKSDIFFDINKKNKYYYCIASANGDGYVNGYHSGTVCEDGTTNIEEKPFCPNNTIIMEEALSIMLRVSGILTNEEADKVRLEIYNGEITQNLSDDVSPKNLDGTVYSFYPDFQKALDYEVIDVDTFGNIQYHKLIEINDGKLRPKQAISKEDFLKMSYVTLKANSCIDKKEDSLPLNLMIRDSECSESSNTCGLTSLNDSENKYDFTVNVDDTFCDAGIKSPEGYIWRFYNHSTGEEIKKYGKYVDNFQFVKNGRWEIFGRVIDNCGNTGEVSNIVNVNNNDYVNINELGEEDISKLTINNYIKNTSQITNQNTNIGFAIGTDYNLLGGNLVVNFDVKINGGTEGEGYTYYWDFGNGTTGNGKNTSATYDKQGDYSVILKITNKNGYIVYKGVKVVYDGTNEDKKLLDNLNNVIDYNLSDGSALDVNIITDYNVLGGSLVVDFNSEIDGGTGNGSYTYYWDFGNGITGNGKSTRVTYDQEGEYNVVLRVIDENGYITYKGVKVVYDSKNIRDLGNDLSVSVSSSTISGQGPLLFNGDVVVSGGDSPYVYYWDFGDGNTGYGRNAENIYKEEGLYKVILYVTDKNGVIASSNILIQVIGLNGKNIDSDGDLVFDGDDLCPLIKGSKNNNGCPIYEETCNEVKDCKSGFYCSEGVCLPNILSNSCEYTGGDAIFGNAICNSCPCDYSLDFVSTLRKCDVIFPAITSPDNKTIYSRGEFYQIK